MQHVTSVLCLRFNCGTGAAQIVSESRVVVGQWHTVTVFRDGMSGWLRMDNDTPISGRSQVTQTHKGLYISSDVLDITLIHASKLAEPYWTKTTFHAHSTSSLLYL